jgi:hypothetical protein
VDDVVRSGLVQPSPGHFVGLQRFRAVLHQRERPHVIVGAHHQPAERVHEGAVAVAAIAGPEEIPDEPFEPHVAQSLGEVREELLFLARADVEERVVRPRLLQQRKVLLLVRRARVVEDHEADRMPVPPEVLIVFLHGLADVPQSVRGNDERQVLLFHAGETPRAGGGLAVFLQPRERDPKMSQGVPEKFLSWRALRQERGFRDF